MSYSSNSSGQIFRWTTFGESHGSSMGVVIEGCPAGVHWNSELLTQDLERRRPGQKSPTGEVLVTERNEMDRCEVLSGIFENKTLGTPIACRVENTNQRSVDYQAIQQEPRRGHADQAWMNKYAHVDLRGGGRSSGRETVSRVIAGSVGRMFVSQLHPEIKITAFAKTIGEWIVSEAHLLRLSDKIMMMSQKDIHQFVDKHPARFLNSEVQISEHLMTAKKNGESYGGVVEVWVDGCAPGLGEPVFYKIKSALAQAMMSLGATCGFEIGGGFALTHQKGTQVHSTQTPVEVYGGVQGGITNGERIVFRVGFKPTSSILDVAQKGRHDPCIVPRAIPVVEAMTWSLLADLILLKRLNNI